MADAVNKDDLCIVENGNAEEKLTESVSVQHSVWELINDERHRYSMALCCPVYQ